MQISLSELKANPGKYVDLAVQQDIYITRKGNLVAKLTSLTADRVAAAKALFGILPPDVDLDRARQERLG